MPVSSVHSMHGFFCTVMNTYLGTSIFEGLSEVAYPISTDEHQITAAVICPSHRAGLVPKWGIHIKALDS